MEELRHLLSHTRHQRRYRVMAVAGMTRAVERMVVAEMTVVERVQDPFLRRRRFCWSESGLPFLSSFFS